MLDRLKALSEKRNFKWVQWKIAIWGPAKAGKTTFALTMPRPIVVLDFEHGIIEEYEKEDDVIIMHPVVFTAKGEIDYEKTIDQTMKMASEIANIQREMDRPLSVVIDSASELHDILKIYNEIRPDAKRMKDGTVMPTEFHWVKMTWRKILFPIVHAGCHVVLIGREKDRFDPNTMRVIGVMPDWIKQTEYFADVLIRVEVMPDGKRKYTIKSRYKSMNDKVIMGQLTFEQLQRLAKSTHATNAKIVR